MRTVLIDTNLLVRFFSRDDLEKAKAVRIFLNDITCGKMQGFIPLVVIAETVHVLKNNPNYRFPRGVIASCFLDLLELPNFKYDGPLEIWQDALLIYTKRNIDFEDAYLVALAEHKGVKQIYSYDRDFDQFSGLERCEP